MLSAVATASGRKITPSDVEPYLAAKVFPVLTEALADLCLLQPDDPLEWLAAQLLKLARQVSQPAHAGTLANLAGDKNAESSIDRKSALHIAQKSQDASSAHGIQDIEPSARDLHGHFARVQTLEAQLPELKSSEFSEKIHSVIQNQGQPDVSNAVEMNRAVAAAMNRADAEFMRKVFQRHASGSYILKSKLMSALREVKAPVLQAYSDLFSSDSSSLENDIFRRVDADSNDLVDFNECECTIDK